MDGDVRAKALKMLDRRDYSRRELTKKLLEKGVAEADAAAAVERLTELGLVDDRRYAALVVRHYAAKGYGIRRVRQELQRRGISREDQEAALEAMPVQDETLLRLLERKLGGDFDRAAVKKAADAMARRGYGWEEISAALEQLRSRDGETP